MVIRRERIKWCLLPIVPLLDHHLAVVRGLLISVTLRTMLTGALVARRVAHVGQIKWGGNQTTSCPPVIQVTDNGLTFHSCKKIQLRKLKPETAHQVERVGRQTGVIMAGDQATRTIPTWQLICSHPKKTYYYWLLEFENTEPNMKVITGPPRNASIQT